VTWDEERDFECFFRARFSSIARTVFLIVHDAPLAEDLASEAFLTAYRRWSSLEAVDHPDAWVRKVAVRLAIRHHGRERARPRLERVAAGAPVESVDLLPDPDLAAALARLPRMQHAAVVLFYYEDRPVAEIALLLQVSESTVKQHLMRARTRLARELGEEVPDAVR
jgi:RNA polymerase sigma factor (sigma-70 family)